MLDKLSVISQASTIKNNGFSIHQQSWVLIQGNLGFCILQIPIRGASLHISHVRALSLSWGWGAPEEPHAGVQQTEHQASHEQRHTRPESFHLSNVAAHQNEALLQLAHTSRVRLRGVLALRHTHTHRHPLLRQSFKSVNSGMITRFAVISLVFLPCFRDNWDVDINLTSSFRLN